VALVALDSLLDAGETDARAGKLAGRVRLLKWPEQLVCIGGVEPSAVVADIAADDGTFGRLVRVGS
jgi:hypothetical protein